MLNSLDAAGRRRSPATMPGFHRGRPPRNKGRLYPADPPSVEEIVAVMRIAGNEPHGLRTRALVVLLWRAGLRISEALALAESDLDRERGGVLVRHGKGGKRREVGMDSWAWEQIAPWVDARVSLPVGALLCVITGPTSGRPCSAAAARSTVRHLAGKAASGGASLHTSCGTHTPSRWPAKACRSTSSSASSTHANLGITSVYLQGIDNSEMIDTVHRRAAPMLPASAGLR